MIMAMTMTMTLMMMMEMEMTLNDNGDDDDVDGGHVKSLRYPESSNKHAIGTMDMFIITSLQYHGNNDGHYDDDVAMQ